MLKKHSIKSYALIAGLATVLFLPVTADADKAADRAMKKDGFGLESTRGNNSVADSLRKADGHPVGAPAGMPAGTMAPGMHPGKMAPGTMAPGMHPGKMAPGTMAPGMHPGKMAPGTMAPGMHPGKMAPGTMAPGMHPGKMAPGTMAPGMHPGKMAPGTMAPGMHPGKMAPGTMAPGMHPGKMAPGTHSGGDSSASDACSQTPDDGWQSVTEVRSEADFQIGFNDAVAGRQFSKFDNDSSIVCVGGDVKSVYVGVAASDSNLGAFIGASMGCNLRNDNLSSGGRGVDKLICP
jgi:hypothetical protein